MDRHYQTYHSDLQQHAAIEWHNFYVYETHADNHYIDYSHLYMQQ